MGVQRAREFRGSPGKERVTGSGKDKVNSGKEESNGRHCLNRDRGRAGQKWVHAGRGLLGAGSGRHREWRSR